MRHICCTYCGIYSIYVVARWNRWFCDQACAYAWDRERQLRKGSR